MRTLVILFGALVRCAAVSNRDVAMGAAYFFVGSASMGAARMGASQFLWIASCIHIGAKGHDRDALLEYLGWARKSKARIALIGDIIDAGLCFGTKHIGSVWDNDSSPEEQIDIAEELFWGVRKQMDSINTGNHENRVEQLTSISPARAIAKRLSVPYHRASHVLNWCGLKVFLAHGVSGGIMTDLNKVMQAYEGFDVIALGHVHELFHLPVRRYVCERSGLVKEKSVHLCRAGSFLRDAPYARFALHRPTEIGSIVLEMRGKNLRIHTGLP